MNIHDSTMTTTRGAPRRQDEGFTLIEILLAIVLVGILAAVAVVGISNLVSKGGKSACQASADSAKAASSVYFASNNTYPATFTQLTTAGSTGAPYTLPTGTDVDSTGLVATNGTNWVLTMTAGTPPTFACT
jgi:prepilin-type N-terminal cleavage/methylation domain-containing protein